MGKACSKQYCRRQFQGEEDRAVEEFPAGDNEPIKLSTYSGSFGGVPPIGHVDTPTTHESLNGFTKSSSNLHHRESRRHSRMVTEGNTNPMQQSRYTNNRDSTAHHVAEGTKNLNTLQKGTIPTILEESVQRNESRMSGVPNIAVTPTSSHGNSNYNNAAGAAQHTTTGDNKPAPANASQNHMNSDPNSFSIYKQLESVDSESSKIRFGGKSVSASNISKGRSGSLNYVGAWKGQLKHGLGTQTWPDGTTYEGNWVDGKATGQGRFRLPNGDMYEGQFSNDMANGKGILQRHDGSRYEGTWWDDMQHGTGVEYWSNSCKYEGGYHRGKKHGYGRYVWPDKSEYCGDWQGNSLSGFGRMVWHDGRRYDGQWLNNQKHGNGKHVWPDGRRYEGQYRMDRRQGHGKLILPDGSSYIGEWFEDKRHGRGIQSNANGVAKEGIWEHGQLKQLS